MKNKRGFLLAEETLKIIIAVICIGFLVYFLVALYFNNKNSQDLDQAKSSLNHVDEAITANLNQVEIYNPKGWVLLSWPYQNEAKLPKSCSNLGWTACLCMVDDINLVKQTWSLLPYTKDIREQFLERSDDKGVCLNNSKGLTVKMGTNQQPISIQPPLQLNIDYENKIITK